MRAGLYARVSTTEQAEEGHSIDEQILAVERFCRSHVLEWQMADLVKRLRLPEDWRDRLEELAEHREERDQVEGRRRYLQGKLRRLRDLYLEGDIEKAQYGRQKAELQAQLDALRMPQQPEIEEAGKTLEELGAVWAGAPKRLQAKMLKTIFEEVRVDVANRRIVCLKPYPQFAPLFRMDGMEEREDGCCYYREEDEEAGPED